MIYFITGNEGKFLEIQALIPGISQININLVEIQEIDPEKVITAKVSEAFKHHAGPFIVEDTSLELASLGGLPGTFIKWFLKSIGDAGLAALAQNHGDTRATARTVIGYGKTATDIQFFEGVITGSLISPRGETGFGWDKIFIPDGQEKTFGEMSISEKNELSMRQIAARKLAEIVKS